MGARQIFVHSVARPAAERHSRAQLALLWAGGACLVVAAVILRFTDGEDAVSPVVGRLGLGLVLAAGAVRAWALLTASPRRVLAPIVGERRLVFDRILRARMTVTSLLAIGAPLLAAVAVVALVDEGWLFAALGMVFAGVGLAIERRLESRRRERLAAPHELLVMLERLSMRADIPVPMLRIERDSVPTAWTSGGRVHVTASLVAMLDAAEQEAVLAHELAHIAHRDAAVMEVASAPSRLLLATAEVLLHPGRVPEFDGFREKAGAVMLGLFYVPPALLLGWFARLLVLDLSRSREFAADAGAAGLTGRPSALAAALLKLEEPDRRIPREDLRLTKARGVLCIAPVERVPGGALLQTHPPLRERIARLEEMEGRLQAAC